MVSRLICKLVQFVNTSFLIKWNRLMPNMNIINKNIQKRELKYVDNN